jgi:hypothetical protein
MKRRCTSSSLYIDSLLIALPASRRRTTLGGGRSRQNLCRLATSSAYAANQCVACFHPFGESFTPISQAIMAHHPILDRNDTAGSLDH